MLRARHTAIAALAAVVMSGAAGLGALTTPAQAQFPYLPKAGGDPSAPASWKLAPGETPTNFGNDWKLAATPEQSTLSDLLVNPKPEELCGIRGASVVDAIATMPAGTSSCVPAGTPVDTAFQHTVGRDDVVISVLDSGIKWNDAGVMTDVRNKVWLNSGELPAPKVDLHAPFDHSTGVDCEAHFGARGQGGDYNRAGGKRIADGHIPYDVLGRGVFNLLAYACDARVAAVLDGSSPRSGFRHGPAGTLTPEDLILAFSDGRDHDGNGYANDIAGWNFVDDNNNPFDDVQYGHGSGEAEDSTGEANTNQHLGTCPNCMVMPLRVGESFIADVNRFAAATVFATDHGASVVQEALGTMNSSKFARQAIEYAYHHGTAVIASAADEAAEHHNQPGALPDTIVVNSVVKYDQTFTGVPPSYLQFNGCTNFGTRVTVSVSSSSCSSNATGNGAGIAGLIYSAAENAVAAGRLKPATDCTRVDGTPCPITPNEVRQLMASGNIAGATQFGQTAPSSGTSPADQGHGAQADDINFALSPEASCHPVPTPSCTDPNLNTVFSPGAYFGVDAPAPARRMHARLGFDEFYGYGRLNAQKAVAAADAGTIPPEANITSPDWFTQLDPTQPEIAIGGYTYARGNPYTCQVQYAPGANPNNGLTTDTPAGDFATAASRWCDGTTQHTEPFHGTVGTISTAALAAAFPKSVKGFAGNENGGTAQTAVGLPNTQPYAFTVRVVVSEVAGAGHPAMTGEDRRQLNLHRDSQMLPGFPRELRTDGASSPVLADLAGQNSNQLVLATSDGEVHAYTAAGGELPGFPVHTPDLPRHPGAPGYAADALGLHHHCAVLGALAAGDLFSDGRTEVVADDLCGDVMAWDGHGRLVFHEHSNPRFSGAAVGFQTVRSNPRDRTEIGFISSPVLGRLNGAPRGPLQIIAAGEDRHVYAWNADGSAVSGFPVLLADPDKLASVDPVTDHLTFSTTRARANPGIDEDQGKIPDTPALADIDGSGKPSIIVGSNEEYLTGTGDEGSLNAGNLTSTSLSAVGQSGVLSFANGRVYAVKPTGGALTCAGGTCHSTAFRPGWPVKVGIILAGLLPDVGEGINGSPVVAPVTCPSGGAGMKIGVAPDAGPAYILNGDGSSCYGKDPTSGADNTLETDKTAGAGQYDHPTFAAVGYPAFGSFDGKHVRFFTPVAGLLRALDLAINDYQGGQDFIGGWDPATGQAQPGYPAQVNDLQFLTGPAVGQITKIGGQSVIGGTASLDLQAFNRSGVPASPAWPKLTGDWTIATPTLGAFGSDANKVVVSITRSGTLAVYQTTAGACTPSSSPRFHHDNYNSGNYTVDAVQPGHPYALERAGEELSFTAAGADGMCGTAAKYELVTSRHPITAQNFASATVLAGAPAPTGPGTRQRFAVPAGAQRYLAVRAVNAAGNVSLPAEWKLS